VDVRAFAKKKRASFSHYKPCKEQERGQDSEGSVIK
jgi:hypothetical protein